MRDEDQHQRPDRDRADDEGDAQRPETGERLTHRRLPPSAGRWRCPWRSGLAPGCPPRTVRASPSFDSVSVTGTPAALASVRMMAVPSNTSSITVASIVFDAPAAGGSSRSRSGRTNSRASSPTGEPVRVEPAEPAEGRVDCASPSCTAATRPVKRLFSPTKEATKAVLRVVVDLERGADLLDIALAHHRHPVGHGQRLALVVGDVDEGDAGPSLDRRCSSARMCWRSFRSRADSGSSSSSTLGSTASARAIATRCFCPPDSSSIRRSAVAGQRDQLQHLRDPAPALGRGHAADLEPEADVLLHRHQREEGEVLEDQRRRPLVRADAAHATGHPGGCRLRVGLDEARDHAQDGRLPAARGAEEAEELALLDREVEIAHRREVAEALHHALELEIVRHRRPDGHEVRARPVPRQAAPARICLGGRDLVDQRLPLLQEPGPLGALDPELVDASSG